MTVLQNNDSQSALLQVASSVPTAKLLPLAPNSTSAADSFHQRTTTLRSPIIIRDDDPELAPGLIGQARRWYHRHIKYYIYIPLRCFEIASILGVMLFTDKQDPLMGICNWNSGLVLFCCIHALLRSLDTVLNLMILNREYIPPAIAAYSHFRLWLYLVNYGWGRWYALVNAQACCMGQPKQYLWVQFWFGSWLGLTANVFIWVDTLVWLIELTLGSSDIMEPYELLGMEDSRNGPILPIVHRQE